MTEPRVAQYGSWKSPITTDLIVSETIELGQIILDGESIYWVEMRPSEKGRYVVVRRDSRGNTTDLTPPEYNARTRVHEYGGGSFVVHNGTLYFSNFQDQRVYRQDSGLEPKAITPESDFRYADFIIDQLRKRIICIREDHSNAGEEAINTLVALNLNGSQESVMLVSGNAFYSSPRLSPDGSNLAWLTWNHPNMPWDGTELRVAEVSPDGTLKGSRLVAGGAEESIFQPEWSPDGTLYFISDRTGWWNLYRWQGRGVESLIAMEAEFGQPQWLFGMSTYAFESDNHLIFVYNHHGRWRLASLNTVTSEISEIENSYTELTYIKAAPGRAAFLAAGPSEFPAIVQLDVSSGKCQALRRSNLIDIDSGFLSTPEPIEFPTQKGRTANAFYYRPKNRDYKAPMGELPPLLVVSHGGPTGAASSALNPRIQYWTSRGIAVLDVNYGGSTGFGREYRQRLIGQWGVIDVDDCINGVRFLMERGEVDSNRLAIRGSSAGGYTTLSALTFRNVFKAGASYYGISDLESLTEDTHKFESRYLDRLIGPYPESRDIYLSRSPIHHVDRFSCPVIFLQGLEDKVVPPDQAERMVNALSSKGIPVAYLTFEGEQHGFRRAETIKRALDAELYFYACVFGFPLSDPVEPIKIENL